MASKKKESEGIALLSIYGDDEDDDMEEDIKEEEEQDEEQDEAGKQQSDAAFFFNDTTTDNTTTINEEDPEAAINNNNSDGDRMDGGFDSANFDDTLPGGNSTPLQSPIVSSPAPPQPATGSDSKRSRRGTFTIVDYGHDEVALSPDAEEGEIVDTGRAMFGAELQTVVSGDFQEKTPLGPVHILTPSTQATQSFEQHDPSELHSKSFAVNESESVEVEEAEVVCLEQPKDSDTLDNFLPPPVRAKCSDELQEKIKKFLSLKKIGKSFNAEVRNRKEYRNPDFLLHAVTYQDIDQIGSCFSKDVFDPHGYDKSDYYDEIEADLKRELERKEQEKKKSQRIDYVSGGTQPGTAVPTPKVNIPISGVSTVIGSGLLSVSTVDAGARDGRPNKKSKWDKVDTDRRNPLPPGGQDSVSAVGAHAALLSAANAGSGYTAFAQQRRREADERRSSDRKLERRS